MDAGPVPKFGLPKSILILVAHLLLNIKKKFMQNQDYIMFLA